MFKLFSKPETNHGLLTEETNPVIFDIGEKLIIRSNEPDELGIGTFQGYLGKDREVPKILLLESGETIYTMGALRRYSKELHDKLQPMEPIEQWNFLTHRHCQIKKKYGKRYKTYKCMCVGCVKAYLDKT